MEPMTPLDPLAWKQLVEAIADQKTILFVGPGATVNFDMAHRQEQFFQQLAAKYPSRILSYHHGDGFLVYKNANEKRLLLSEIKAFYRSTNTNPVLELLAQIPFHLYVVVTPDLALNQAFAQRKLPFKHQFYATKIKRTLEESPTSAQPLLYNLLGCETEPESLITNHSDFFDLIKSIYGDKNLPDDLVACFSGDRTHNIIFLGFEFDKWYFQMLLHLLRINFDEGFLYAAAQAMPMRDNKTLMEAQFKVSFVSTDIEGFVKTLHSQFSETQLRRESVDNEPKRVIVANVVKFVSQAWTPQDFETFCLIHFDAVHSDFTQGMEQTARINLLMRHLKVIGGYEKLLEEGRAENPFQYDACGPYYEA